MVLSEARKLTLHPYTPQTFDTNYSISAKGRKVEVHLESHVAGVMMLFPEQTKEGPRTPTERYPSCAPGRGYPF